MPTAPFIWAMRSTRGSRILSSSRRPWPASTRPTSPASTATGCPSRSRWKSSLGRKRLELPVAEVLAACRAYAQKYVDLQTSQFERIGCFGRWEKPYKTMTRDYEATDAWRRSMDSSRRASSIAVSSRSTGASTTAPRWPRLRSSTRCTPVPRSTCATGSRRMRRRSTRRCRAVRFTTIIWTTTPWTLPASLAVAFHPDFDYVAHRRNLQRASRHRRREGAPSFPLFSAERVGAQEPQPSPGLHRRRRVGRSSSPPPASWARPLRLPASKAPALDRVTFQHPFLDRSVLGVLATYVTADQGTGAVHTAPAHGADDFYTGQRYGLDPTCRVDASGRLHVDPAAWNHAAPAAFEGLNGMGRQSHHPRHAGGARRIAGQPPTWSTPTRTAGAATSRSSIAPPSSGSSGWKRRSSAGTARRPPSASWPSKRSTRWSWDPAWGKERITNMIATRPDWCISRQKIWDVPIAVFLCEHCGKPIVSERS
jgi:isoleucyl-tRNA synthetase